MVLKTTAISEMVTEVSLNRPQLHNALDAELVKALTQTFNSLSRKPKLRAILLRGMGPSFCAGGDLNWMRQTLGATLNKVERDSRLLANMYEAIYQCPVPVLALAHGNIMGGGLGLLAVADIVTAESNSRFCFSEVRLGIPPSIISAYILRKVGSLQPLPFMLTAQSFHVQEAKNLSLIQHHGDLNACETYLADQLRAICANGPQAVRATKMLWRNLAEKSWAQARTLTIRTNAKCRKSAEGQEGMRAFLEKRAPSWRED